MLRINKSSISLLRNSRTKLSLCRYSTVRIDDIEVKCAANEGSKLVPEHGVRLLGREALEAPEILGHLRWMAQKYNLGQDMFLCGHPTPVRRLLAMTFAELCNIEVEYIALTKDTTESDLKQRKEIVDNNVLYFDQAPVRAAIHGRLLIIDGMEKAERNVLPTLNNLLENREMALEDGRFLTPRDFNSNTTNRLVKVHPNFRVLALGIPVPPYNGRTLDPPLRSRFQSRFVDELQVDTILKISTFNSLQRLRADSIQIQQLLQFYESMKHIKQKATMEQQPLSDIPNFSIDNILFAAKVLDDFTPLTANDNKASPFTVTINDAISRSTPALTFLNNFINHRFKTEINHCFTAAAKNTYYNKTSPNKDKTTHTSTNIDSSTDTTSNAMIEAQQTMNTLHKIPEYTTLLPSQIDVLHNLIIDHVTSSNTTGYHQYDHSKHICIIGDKGSGKSYIAEVFAKLFNYNVRLFPLYQELTSRDLLQRRYTITTESNGSRTGWIDSPLITAARTGDLCILDNLHRIDAQALYVLNRLFQDKCIDLPSGERLMYRDETSDMANHDSSNVKIDVMDTSNAITKVSYIHPNFRVIALALPPTTSSDARDRYLASELGFTYHQLRNNVSLGGETTDEIDAFISRYIAQHTDKDHIPSSPAINVLSTSEMHRIGKYISQGYHALLATNDNNLQLSLRHIIRLLDSITSQAFPVNTTGIDEVYKSQLVEEFKTMLLLKFNTNSTSQYNFQTAMQAAGLSSSEIISSSNVVADSLTITIDDKSDDLVIGNVRAPRRVPEHQEKVPHTTFFYNPQHIFTLQQLLADYKVDKRAMLLIGNQGVGKNKLIDKLLELLNAEREYMQLHRDTSIFNLTVIPTINNNQIVYQDSPLVTAAKLGRVLVIDEVDKADNSVVCLLKSLVEDEEVVLYDNRRLMSQDKILQRKLQDDSSIIPIHPDFKLVVLANRPGFPFLGNQFFAECGDVFSIHAIDNLDMQSELQLLMNYATKNIHSMDDIDNVATQQQRQLIKNIVRAFSHLRNLHDTAVLNYPFSLREAISIVKHVAAYPNDSIQDAVENVLAFDTLNVHVKDSIVKVFNQYNIPITDKTKELHQRHPPVLLQPTISLSDNNYCDTNHYNMTVDIARRQRFQSSSVSMKANETQTPPQNQSQTQKQPTNTSTKQDYQLQSSRLQSFTEEIAVLNLQPSNQGDFPGIIVDMQFIDSKTNTKDLLIVTTNPIEVYIYHNILDELSNFVTTLPNSRVTDTLRTNSYTKVELLSRDVCNRLSHSHNLRPFILSHNQDGTQVIVPGLKLLYTIKQDAASGEMKVASHRLPIDTNTVEMATTQKKTLFGDMFPTRKQSTPRVQQRQYNIHVISNRYSLLYDEKYGGYGYVIDSVNKEVYNISNHLNSILSNNMIKSITNTQSKDRMEVLLTVQSTSDDQLSHLLINMDVKNSGSLEIELTPIDVNYSQPSSMNSSIVNSSSSTDTRYILGGNAVSGGYYASITNDNSLTTYRRSENHKNNTNHDIDNFVSTPITNNIINIITNNQHARSSKSINHKVFYNSDYHYKTVMKPILEVIDVPKQELLAVELGTPSQNTNNTDRSSRTVNHGMNIVTNMTPLHLPQEHSKIIAVGYLSQQIRFYDMNPQTLLSSLQAWKSLHGSSGDGSGKGGNKIVSQKLSSTLSKNGQGVGSAGSVPRTGTNMPKHGVNDGKVHTGGNTYTGGTGGSDTAGLGGRGGPYRYFDPSIAGNHTIHQVSDEAKKEVSEESRRRAKEIAQQALAKRLEELQMSTSDYQLYSHYKQKIEPDAGQLRTILQELDRRSQERVWLKHQSFGELDDARLVDGLAGDKLVFKRRGIPSYQQNKQAVDSNNNNNDENIKKRLHFVVDVSASMYRFNAVDRRLERMLEAMLMVLESMPNHTPSDSSSSAIDSVGAGNIEYMISGHSGDVADINFLSYTDPRPSSERDKLLILQQMAAHSQYTFAGDNTLEALELAVSEAMKDPVTVSSGNADNVDRYVFVVSDANFERYNIDPRQIARAMTSNKRVKVHLILIASLDDQAAQVQKLLPVGHCHLCFASTDLPAIFRKILLEEAFDV